MLIYKYYLYIIHGKIDFAEVSENLAKYRSENSYNGPSK